MDTTSADLAAVDSTSAADSPRIAQPGRPGRPDERPSRWKTITRRVGIGIGILVLVYAVLLVVSWLMIDSRDDLAFFDTRPGDHRPLVFAHQGGEDIAPSNTLTAFRESIAIGADVLDTDMHRTSDGALVLIHDETVDRTSDGTGEVRDLTLDELRELDFGYRFTTDGGATYPYRGAGHGIVTLDELFTEFPETRFGVEIKQTTTEAATELCALIEQHGYEQRVLVSSFSQENMDHFRSACPAVATSATTDETRRFFIFQYARLSGFSPPPFDSLQVPEYRDGTHVLTDSFVRAARAWNLPVVPWTIDEPDDFVRIIDDFDPDGINTNRPDLLVSYLEDR